MTTPMREALTSRLYAALQHKGVTVGDIVPAVDAALETSGYADLAALATQSVALQQLVADEVGTPTPELTAALAATETARASVAANPFNADLVALP